MDSESFAEMTCHFVVPLPPNTEQSERTITFTVLISLVSSYCTVGNGAAGPRTAHHKLLNTQNQRNYYTGFIIVLFAKLKHTVAHTCRLWKLLQWAWYPIWRCSKSKIKTQSQIIRWWVVVEKARETARVRKRKEENRERLEFVLSVLSISRRCRLRA